MARKKSISSRNVIWELDWVHQKKRNEIFGKLMAHIDFISNIYEVQYW